MLEEKKQSEVVFNFFQYENNMPNLKIEPVKFSNPNIWIYNLFYVLKFNLNNHI